MTSIFYGIRRLLLLNTASYALGNFPLDRPLSISAPNNRGKSTAINALQFPFLSNMNDMAFPRSNEDTRRYYFPYDNSYVVSEIVTDTGTFVVGASGKGQASGYEYQLFAYQSKLDMSDFLVSEDGGDDKVIRNFKELGSHLAKRGVWVKALQPKQMRDALMGKTITLPNGEKFTIGIFRLRRMTDENYRLFIRVFKNLLHMNNVNLDEMKRLLIDVLLPGQGSTAVDFMARYKLLNEEVGKAKGRADTAIKISEDVKKLTKEKEHRDEAYGILRRLFPQITSAYESERYKRAEEIEGLRHKINTIEPRMEELKNSQPPLQKIIQELAIKENNLKQQVASINEGEARFALSPTVDELQLQIKSMTVKVERLVGELQRTHPDDIGGTKNDIKVIKQQIEQLEARLSAINNNLLFVLTESLGEPQIQTISKLLNRDILASLPLGDDGASILDENRLIEWFKEILSYCKDGYYDDGRVRICLDKLQPIDIEDYFNYDTIREQLDRLQKRKKQLDRDLEVALDYKSMEIMKGELLDNIKAEETNLSEYKSFLEAKQSKSEIEKMKVNLSAELENATNEQSEIGNRLLALGQEKQTLSVESSKKQAALDMLVANREKVAEIPNSEPQGTPPSHQLPTALEDMIDTYLLALDSRQSTREQINQRLAIIEGKDGLRFTSGQDEDTTIQELIEAVEGVDEYVKQQENCQKAVCQEIGALLKGLTDRFDSFEHEIRRFNRQMNAKKISNISRIEFIVDGNNDILRAVQQIVGQDSLFSDPENVHRAVKRLDDLITKKGVKLSLESMFNLGIEVELENKKVTSSFNDANIQSTGTGLTVKVILNVMLLNRLLFSKDGQIVNIPIYIDEAGQIDPSNQQTLIDQCMTSGFVPVFASVEAQAVADYWIGLNEIDGRIYVDQEDWFRLTELEDSVQEAVDA